MSPRTPRATAQATAIASGTTTPTAINASRPATRRLVVPDVAVRRAAIEQALRGVEKDAGVLGRIAAGGVVRQEHADRQGDEQRDRDDSDAHRATDSLILCADAATGRDRGGGR